MSTLKTNAIEPEGATTELSVGIPGQNVVIGGSGGIKSNTFKDSGGGYRYAAFTTVGAQTWTCPTGVTSAEILVVAGGGGGGGRYYGGGGGGGGIVHDTAYTVVPGVVYDLTVGDGGDGGGSETSGSAGGDSTWNNNNEGSGVIYTAKGGGAGGGGSGSASAGAGGSGGGRSYSNANPTGATNQSSSGTGSSGTRTAYGNAGGTNAGTSNGSGGGGAGSSGAGDSHPNGGAGGDGAYFANFTDWGTNRLNIRGSGGYFGGGGGGAGGGHASSPGPGGFGGGGQGAAYASGNDQLAANSAAGGLPNTGGGGGAGAHNQSISGQDAGSGIIIIRYQDPTKNTIFTSNGSGVITGGTGFADTVLLSSQTVSNQASISFTSGLDSTYKEYVFSFINISPATDQARWSFQVNADGQSGYNETITSSTWRAYNGASGHAFSTQTDADQANGTAVQQLAYSLGNEAFESVAGELHLYNPSSTTFVTTFKSRTTVNGYEPAAIDWYTTGYINVTGAITQIQFAMTTGNFDGTVKMYGIK